MLQFRFVSLLFLCNLAVSLSVDDDDYVIELENAAEYVQEDRGRYNATRSARFFSLVQSPIIDFVLKTASANYVPRKPGDLFDFLRDPYPLPGGESCKFYCVVPKYCH